MKFFFHLYDKEKDPSLVNYLINGFGAPLATVLNKMHVTANFVTVFRGSLVVVAIYLYMQGIQSYYLPATILIHLGYKELNSNCRSVYNDREVPYSKITDID